MNQFNSFIQTTQACLISKLKQVLFGFWTKKNGHRIDCDAALLSNGLCFDRARNFGHWNLGEMDENMVTCYPKQTACPLSLTLTLEQSFIKSNNIRTGSKSVNCLLRTHIGSKAKLSYLVPFHSPNCSPSNYNQLCNKISPRFIETKFKTQRTRLARWVRRERVVVRQLARFSLGPIWLVLSHRKQSTHTHSTNNIHLIIGHGGQSEEQENVLDNLVNRLNNAKSKCVQKKH